MRRKATKACLIAAVISLFSMHTQAMHIAVCADQMILSGPVEGDEYRHVLDVLSKNPGIKVAVLRNSPGGKSSSGYSVGALFRERGLITYVSGYCRSSCSRFFLGGKERYFTDDYPAARTVVAFHSNYEESGAVKPGSPERLKEFIAKYSDGKADPHLVGRWVDLQNRKGFAYFYHPQGLRRKDGVSVLLCQGDEPRRERWSRCQRIEGYDAISMGIATSLELRHSCDAGDLPGNAGEPSSAGRGRQDPRPPVPSESGFPG